MENSYKRKLTPLMRETLWVGGFLFSFLIVLSFLGLTIVDKLIFSMGFVWHEALLHEKLKDKALNRQFRYSFIGIIFRVQRIIEERLPRIENEWISFLPRAILPTAFALLLFLVSNGANPLYCFLGVVLNDSCHRVHKKLKSR